MGWRGRRARFWPGRGPFSHLPPWKRPGWLYGRGACWWLYAPNLRANIPPGSAQASMLPPGPTTPFIPTLTKEQEAQMLEQQMKFLQSQLDAIKKRIEELGGD